MQLPHARRSPSVVPQFPAHGRKELYIDPITHYRPLPPEKLPLVAASKPAFLVGSDLILEVPCPTLLWVRDKRTRAELHPPFRIYRTSDRVFRTLHGDRQETCVRDPVKDVFTLPTAVLRTLGQKAPRVDEYSGRLCFPLLLPTR